MQQSIPKRILPVIVFAQFAGTSLWFAGNAVIPDLVVELQLNEYAVGYITSAVQFGFISGTLLFAFLSVADRISPSKVFLGCAILGASANALTVYSGSLSVLILVRFATGFFLAGIYPVGMKIASDWHDMGLGKALGYLVGALVLGTAFPHLVRFIASELPWRVILFATSWLATAGGVLLYFTVPDGPYRSKQSIFQPSALFKLFKHSNFRAAAFGYFGHMWELYAFWAFVPIMLTYYNEMNPGSGLQVGIWSFIIIGIGGAGCAIGGHRSLKSGSKRVAQWSLAISGLSCLLSPLIFDLAAPVFLMFLMVWGFFVVSDSPQFSTLVAASSDRDYVATGLTIVNSIGFAITIISIQLVNMLWANLGSPFVFLILAIGPALGYLSLIQYGKNPK
ncbi:MFS transporter [Balneolaceae bacterium YR4-1]|uniref:MFS transporter n=1 Tax=Halalkalibaculum roseum TaxID=2709311 RepID=A0A6M1TCD5_9BACT|nr:MFS transporter [Halalkalibaculum roseum]NGP77783.1 MFS transporter [Halalkalibaculum roseum]